jgi:pimeloyl-ACP methyl ester carboxylesterase
MSSTAATTPPAPAALPSERVAELRLADGRALSYAVYGDPEAVTTVLVLDGPGSRGLARGAADAAGRLGLRLIAPDRPGFLGSSPHPGRTFASVAADVLALADHVGAERFGLLSQSGGTPYALTLAGMAADRVTGLAFVGGITPLGEPGALEDVHGGMRTNFVLARRAPFLLRPLFGLVSRIARKDPDKIAQKVLDDAPPADRKVMEDPAWYAIHRQCTIEALASPKAFAQEAAMLARPWNVDVAAIGAPVALWVGERDGTHPPVMACRLAAWLGAPPVTVVPEAGVFAMRPVYGDALAFAASGVA